MTLWPPSTVIEIIKFPPKNRPWTFFLYILEIVGMGILFCTTVFWSGYAWYSWFWNLRIPAMYEVKNSKICNFWTFWPVIQLMNHLFQIRQKAKSGIITELSTKISRSAVFASCIAGILNFSRCKRFPGGKFFLQTLYTCRIITTGKKGRKHWISRWSLKQKSW